MHHVRLIEFGIWDLIFDWSISSAADQDGSCTYGAPSVAAWAAVALAVTSPHLREQSVLKDN